MYPLLRSKFLELEMDYLFLSLTDKKLGTLSNEMSLLNEDF